MKSAHDSLYQILIVYFMVGSSSPCPSLNTEVDEHTPIGTVLFIFTTAAHKIKLEPQDPEFSSYLTLRQTNLDRYEVLLNADLDLNVINPTSTPRPMTYERVTCPETSAATYTAEQRAVRRAVLFRLQCEIAVSNTNIQVNSEVIVAVRDVNDKVPVFLCAPYSKAISELTPVSTTVFTLRGLAADLDIDGGIASYHIQSGGSGMFGISGAASDGYIVVTGELDYDRGQRNYSLNITVTDLGDPPLTSWTLLTLTLTDADDQSPQFDHHVHYLSLPDQDESIIGVAYSAEPPLHAADMDVGLNTTVLYALHNGESNVMTYLSVTAQGEIVPVRKLQRELTPQLVLNVKAYQSDHPETRYAMATVIVTVTPRNIHRPEFIADVYEAQIVENAPSGTLVVTVTAVDRDEGTDGLFVYKLLGDEAVFGINPASGAVYVNNGARLDRETQDIYNIHVYAMESESADRWLSSNNATVTITLLDVNDNSPKFTREEYNFTVRENLPINTTIGEVQAVDADLGTNGLVHYSFVFGTANGRSVFGVDQTNGGVSVLALPTMGTYTLGLMAHDNPVNGQRQRSTVVMMNIMVISANVAKPAFIGMPYVVEVAENAALGTTVLTIQAFDPDRGSTLTFGVGDQDAELGVNPDLGSVTVKRSLDREQRSNFNVTVFVTDGIHVTSAVVMVTVLDVNDNAPQFLHQPYRFLVRENTPPGGIGHVQVTDADSGINGRVELSIVEEWAQKLFEIEQTTAMLRTRVALDRETSAAYMLTVEARDRGSPALWDTAIVMVTVEDTNDNRPVFTTQSYYASVPEGMEKAFVVKLQAFDIDMGVNADVRYDLQATSTASAFTIDSETGDMKTARSLDRDTMGGGELEVRVVAYNRVPYENSAAENATATVKVTVLDKNDHSAMFTMSQYVFSVKENVPIGHIIGRVSAYDADSSPDHRQLHYWLLHPPMTQLGTQMFSIEADSGILHLQTPLSLANLEGITSNQDRSEDMVVELTVAASDLVPFLGNEDIKNVTAKVKVIIEDVNDHAPTFPKALYVVNVPENEAVNTSLVPHDFSAFDADQGHNARLTYSLQNNMSMFAIDGSTGELWALNKLDADSELGASSFSLVVIATDSGTPRLSGSALVEIQVTNINDNAPRFSQSEYRVQVREDEPIGSAVTEVSAVDADGDELVYSLHDGPGSLFTVTSTGTVVLSGSLDYEADSRIHSILVRVTETSDKTGVSIVDPHSMLVSVVIQVLDANDHVPEFRETQYSAHVEEDSQQKNIVTIFADDADSGRYGSVVYSLDSHNDLFIIDRTQGMVSVKPGARILYTEHQALSVVVRASDEGDPPQSALTVLHVTVIDVNNHPPRCDQQSGEVKEGMNAGADVLLIEANDVDMTSNLNFYNLDLSLPFSISQNSGQLITTKLLDREETSLYHFNITVSDGVFETFCPVTIKILDVNDNAPHFAHGLYVADITSTGLTPNREVLSVPATDADDSNNGYVTYWLVGGDGLFTIDHHTAEIRLGAHIEQRFKQHLQAEYEFVVFAQDHGVPTLSSNTTVIVTINATKNSPPLFTQFGYDITIEESKPLEVGIFTFELKNRVFGSYSMDITSGNSDDIFGISQKNALFLKKPLDFELTEFHLLSLQVTDKDDLTLTSQVKVRVTVIDADDNVPVFSPHPRQLYISYNLAPFQTVFCFHADDADSKENNNAVQYRLTNHQDLFMINTETGALQTRLPQPINKYNLVIEAFNPFNPESKSSTTLTVDVVMADTFNNVPVFSEDIVDVMFNESYYVPRVITDLSAKISGGEVDSGISYRLTGGWHRNSFIVNPNNGVITAIKALDRETTRGVYSLIVTAVNRQQPLYGAHCLVIVTIEDTNDVTPSFAFTQYDISVAENVGSAHQVAALTTRDADQQPQLDFFILKDNSENLFAVTSVNNDAIITTQGPLDRDTMDPMLNGIYVLWVGISDGPHSGSPALVRIKVDDVKDSPPAFTSRVIEAQIPEDAAPCHHVTSLTATDPDQNDRLIFKLVGGGSTHFSVLPTGEVITNCSGSSERLNRELQDTYNLQVQVEDSAGFQAFGSVVITILDVNDNPPRFLDVPLTFSTTEGPESLGFSAEISVEDLDLGINGEVDFYLHSGQHEEFHISPTTNIDGVSKVILTTVAALDREKAGVTLTEDGRAVYYLSVMAQDQGYPQLTMETMVRVYVSDINDNPPSFKFANFDVSVSEATSVGLTILIMETSDRDHDNNKTFTMLTDSAYFGVVESTGAVYVKAALDVKDVGERFTTTVQVSDGKYTDETSLTIRVTDINNHDPVFDKQSYNFSVMENNLDPAESQGQVIGKVMATDDDLGLNGQIMYSLTSSTFGVHSDGSVYIMGSIDRETREHYELVVIARDRGNPPRHTLCEISVSVLDVNDNAPQFVKSPFSASVEEHSPVGTTLHIDKLEYPAVLAVDADSGTHADINYSLRGPAAGLFHIHSQSGEITVADSEQLDRERSPSHLLVLVATDNAGAIGDSLSTSATLFVTVTDANDQKPQFSQPQYHFEMEENALPGTVLGTIQATDGDIDDHIEFFLSRPALSAPPAARAPLWVDRLTGEVSVVGPVDREVMADITIKVNAVDTAGHTASAVVTVTVLDVNDCTPLFLNSLNTVSVVENSAAGTVLTEVLVTDDDAGRNGMTKVTLNSAHDVPFLLNSTSGLLSTTRPLDHEEMAAYDLTLIAHDFGDPQLTSTTILHVLVTDSNDHEPEFLQKQYRISVLEKMPVGSVIGHITASDKDSGENGNVTYHLGMGADYISVELDTGILRVARILNRAQLLRGGVLTSADDPSMTLTLAAQDGGRPPRVTSVMITVTVDEINDDRPHFDKPFYEASIPENSLQGTHVLEVAGFVNNAQTQLIYSLLDTSTFVIENTHQGVITVGSLNLDRETTASHSFTVQAVDGRIPQGTAYTRVLVTITDTNDHAPLFSQPSYEWSVAEGQYEQFVIGQLKAVDDDVGDNAQLTYSLRTQDARFSVSTESGELSITSDLDHEVNSKIELLVTCHDLGNPAKSTDVIVTLTITDTNDNHPIFIDVPKMVEVDRFTKIGQKIGEVLAVDPDAGLNGTIVYSLQDSDVPFYIQHTASMFGVLRVASDLSATSQTSFNLSIIASDLSLNPLTSTFTITVVIVDANDQPRFEEHFVELYVGESTAVGTEIGTLKAVGNCQYYIISGNDAGFFSITMETGEIKLRLPLLGRLGSSWLLVVSARHPQVREQIDSAKVLITVVSETSAAAVFDSSEPYHVTVMENLPPPSLVVNLHTQYHQSTVPITYYFVENQYPDLFRLNTSSGEIWCMKSLDRESIAEFHMLVAAKVYEEKNVSLDVRSKRHSVSPALEVVVAVGDENDNAPYFLSDPLVVGVSQKADVNDEIYTLQALDHDAGNLSLCWYSLLDSEPPPPVHLDPLSGVLRLAWPVAMVTQADYWVKVSATDNLGQGHQVMVDMKIVMLDVDHEVLVVFDTPLVVMETRIKHLLRSWSNSFGWAVHCSYLGVHYDNGVHNDNQQLQYGRSELYVYAVDQNTSSIVEAKQLIRSLEHLDLEAQRVVEVRAAALRQETNNAALSQAEVGLIVLCLIVMFGTIILAVVIILAKKKRAQEQRLFPYPGGLVKSEHKGVTAAAAGNKQATLSSGGHRTSSGIVGPRPCFDDHDVYGMPIEIGDDSLFSHEENKPVETRDMNLYLGGGGEMEQPIVHSSSASDASSHHMAAYDNLGHTISVVESGEEPPNQPVLQSCTQPNNQSNHQKNHPSLTIGRQDGNHSKNQPPSQSHGPLFNHPPHPLRNQSSPSISHNHSISHTHSLSNSQYDPITVIEASPREIHVKDYSLYNPVHNSNEQICSQSDQSSEQSVNQAADPDGGWMAPYIPDYEVNIVDGSRPGDHRANAAFWGHHCSTIIEEEEDIIDLTHYDQHNAHSMGESVDSMHRHTDQCDLSKNRLKSPLYQSTPSDVKESFTIKDVDLTELENDGSPDFYYAEDRDLEPALKHNVHSDCLSNNEASNYDKNTDINGKNAEKLYNTSQNIKDYSKEIKDTLSRKKLPLPPEPPKNNVTEKSQNPNCDAEDGKHLVLIMDQDMINALSAETKDFSSDESIARDLDDSNPMKQLDNSVLVSSKPFSESSWIEAGSDDEVIDLTQMVKRSPPWQTPPIKRRALPEGCSTSTSNRSSTIADSSSEDEDYDNQVVSHINDSDRLECSDYGYQNGDKNVLGRETCVYLQHYEVGETEL